MFSGYIGEMRPWSLNLWKMGTSTKHILDGFSRAVVQSNPIQSNPLLTGGQYAQDRVGERRNFSPLIFQWILDIKYF